MALSMDWGKRPDSPDGPARHQHLMTTTWVRTSLRSCLLLYVQRRATARHRHGCAPVVPHLDPCSDLLAAPPTPPSQLSAQQAE